MGLPGCALLTALSGNDAASGTSVPKMAMAVDAGSSEQGTQSFTLAEDVPERA
jgi:hypothetical protein